MSQYRLSSLSAVVCVACAERFYKNAYISRKCATLAKAQPTSELGQSEGSGRCVAGSGADAKPANGMLGMGVGIESTDAMSPPTAASARAERRTSAGC